MNGRESERPSPSLSVCIITLNEEKNLPRCLGSVSGLATQIVVVDSLSHDRTCEIAAAAGAEVVRQEFLGHVQQKQIALDRATEDWVLCLDADEWLDDELRRSIEAVLGSPPPDAIGGYRLNRRPFYLGRWIGYGGWSPDWKLRLVRRGRARWCGYDPHDHLEVTGTTERLRGRLRHFPHPDLADHVATINTYTDILETSIAPGAARSLFGMLLEPPLMFVRDFIVRGGFLDGMRGFIAAAMTSFYTFLKYAKHWEKKHRGAQPEKAERNG